MGKRCPEEFNPWPPFVDIFASVILVLLLFLLITIVNIGYYAQFKHKVSYTASVVTEAPVQPEQQTKAPPAPVVKCVDSSNKKKKDAILEFSFHKVSAPQDKSSNNSLFEGGKQVGNAVSYAVNKEQKEFTKQQLKKKDLILTVKFQDKEIFLNSKIKRKLKLFISSINRRSKRAIYTIYATDPTNIISSTISRQISLGRVLNVKNIISRTKVKSKNIKINLQKEMPSSNVYGDIIIKVHIP